MWPSFLRCLFSGRALAVRRVGRHWCPLTAASRRSEQRYYCCETGSSDLLITKLTDWRSEEQIDRLVDRLIDWLIDCVPVFVLVCALQGQGTLASHSLAGRKNASSLLRHAVGVGALGVAMRTATKTFWKTILGCSTDQVHGEACWEILGPSVSFFCSNIISLQWPSFMLDATKHSADMLALRVPP